MPGAEAEKLSGCGLLEPLFDQNILADDQSMRRHLAQGRKHTLNVLIGIDKREHNRQLSTCIDQV